MKTITAYQRMRSFAACGLFGCATLALTPLGCAGVPPRVQYLNNRPPYPLITEERVVGCFKDYAKQLEQGRYRVHAKVQVDPEGRYRNVVVDGVPDSAPDFAACLRITLREMTIPSGMLKLRPDQPVGSTNGKTNPTGNAIANPLVVAEALLILAELAIEWGGVEVEFTVNVETVAWAAAATQVAVGAKSNATTDEKKPLDNCAELYAACMGTPAGRARGNHWNETRCGTCRNVCQKEKSWPSTIPIFGKGNVSCY